MCSLVMCRSEVSVHSWEDYAQQQDSPQKCNSICVCVCVLQHAERRSKSQRATSRLLVTPTDTLRTHTVSGEYLLHPEKRCTHTHPHTVAPCSAVTMHAIKIRDCWHNGCILIISKHLQVPPTLFLFSASPRLVSEVQTSVSNMLNIYFFSSRLFWTSPPWICIKAACVGTTTLRSGMDTGGKLHCLVSQGTVSQGWAEGGPEGYWLPFNKLVGHLWLF